LTCDGKIASHLFVNSKYLFFLVVLGSLTFQSRDTLAGLPVTFDIQRTIDYPGAEYTLAFGINDRGDVTGAATYHNFQRSYVLFANGTFSPLVANPAANYGSVNFTGINNERTTCGWYLASDSYHGFLYADGTFTDIVVDSSPTNVAKVNDAGNFCGSIQPEEAFVSINGVVTLFTVPGADATYANGINNLNQVVGDYWVDGHVHGFRRDADGTLNLPIDAPDSTDTYLYAINDNGLMVGQALDGHGYHGILFRSPRESALYDYPGASITDFQAINKSGQICGSYYDGLHHGFVVRVRSATGE
jgi:uncharacterized membrane protein